MQYTVKYGIDILNKKLTIKGALLWANKNIPNDLKLAGFKPTLFISDNFIRVNYGK